MRIQISTLVLVAAIAVGCTPAATVSSSGGEITSAAPPNARRLPAGSAIQATFDQSIGTKQSHQGDMFTASVSDPVVAQSGEQMIPAGARVYGHVSDVHAGNSIGQQSYIRLAFDSLTFSGRRYPIDASVSNVNVRNEVNKSGATRGAVTGAAAGAVLGAIISGGDLAKILTGGVLGAAAGTVISLGTGDVESVIPAGSSMTLTTSSPIVLR